jgi:coproporphyrinogen III oxidase
MNRDQIVDFLLSLRKQIIEKFESYEPKSRFEKKPWNHHTGGGGEIAVIRGDVFEKAAVNWSAVSGDKFPLGGDEGAFFATGISLITHMKNPKAPTVHMNIRYIETAKTTWLGGGYDLTPMGFPFDEDTAHFHKIAKATLDPFGEEVYPNFSQAASDYFFIPHWKKERGVGGIFFDQYNTGNASQDYALWEAVGTQFLSAITPIYDKRIHEPYTEEDRQKQLAMRGHYVEFNLIYDRGTKFGFSSGGNPEAILCSLPPLASW